MGQKTTTAVAMLLALALAACTGERAAREAGDVANVKRLVLYYSQTGTTRAVARALQKELGADIESIEVEEPYAGSYNETIERVQVERRQGITPKTKPLAHNPKEYDVVFLGYPIWFGSYAPPVAGLLQQCDFSDTKVVPFCTFGSGGLEASADELRAKLPRAEIADGYGVRTARIGQMPGELHRFLIEQGHLPGELQPLPHYSGQRPVTPQESAIFAAATQGYIFPLGSPVTCGSRIVEWGTEYMFVAKNISPDGTESYSTVYVLQPGGEAESPQFTKVVR